MCAQEFLINLHNPKKRFYCDIFWPEPRVGHWLDSSDAFHPYTLLYVTDNQDYKVLIFPQAMKPYAICLRISG